MELSKYVKQILNIYNYYDGAIVIDRKGIIEYYYNSRKDINTLTNENRSIAKVNSSLPK